VGSDDVPSEGSQYDTMINYLGPLACEWEQLVAMKKEDELLAQPLYLDDDEALRLGITTSELESLSECQCMVMYARSHIACIQYSKVRVSNPQWS
jgi:hypothetical protein